MGLGGVCPCLVPLLDWGACRERLGLPFSAGGLLPAGSFGDRVLCLTRLLGFGLAVELGEFFLLVVELEA